MKDLAVARWQYLALRFDELALRERVLVLVTTVACVGFLWELAVMGPLLSEYERVAGRVGSMEKQLAADQAEARNIRARTLNDPDAGLRATRDALEAALARLEADIGQRTANLVPPGQMAELLEAVLKGSPGLDLVSATSLPSRPLIDTQSPDAAEDNGGEGTPAASLYRHGMRITVAGSYGDLHAYLTRLEALKWGFVWSRLDYDVVEYPRAHLTLHIQTLSTQEVLIDV